MTNLTLVGSSSTWKEHRRTWLPKTLTVMKGDSTKFESQGMYHSAYFILQTENTFTYYSVYEVGYDLCRGELFKPITRAHS